MIRIILPFTQQVRYNPSIAETTIQTEISTVNPTANLFRSILFTFMEHQESLNKCPEFSVPYLIPCHFCLSPKSFFIFNTFL